jgi:WD40 repeat protein
VLFAAFSPDGSRIVTTSADKMEKSWDPATAGEVAEMHGFGQVNSLAFSPDGSRLVFASNDKTAHIWGRASTQALRGHEDAVLSAAFSPDGSRIVTASLDNTARVWDAATAKEIAVLRGHDRAVASAAFSPDGSHVVTASGDGNARIWDAHFATMSAQDLLDEACKHRLSDLSTMTRDEMRLAGFLDDLPPIDVCAPGEASSRP